MVAPLLARTSNLVNALSSYTFTFTTGKNIPKLGFVLVTLNALSDLTMTTIVGCVTTMDVAAVF